MSKSSIQIFVQVNTEILENIHLPEDEIFLSWIEKTLEHAQVEIPKELEITIRFVSEKESAELNEQYRKKQGPTNILSFTYPEDPKTKTPFTGDLIICLPKIIEEANEQDKAFLEHLNHLIVHGTLHLMGYDHMQEDERKVMEALEDEILAL